MAGAQTSGKACSPHLVVWSGKLLRRSTTTSKDRPPTLLVRIDGMPRSAELSHRDYRSLTDPTFPAEVLLEGTQLKHLAQVDFEALRIPERRFVLSTSVSTQSARIWSDVNHS